MQWTRVARGRWAVGVGRGALRTQRHLQGTERPRVAAATPGLTHPTADSRLLGKQKLAAPRVKDRVGMAWGRVESSFPFPSSFLFFPPDFCEGKLAAATTKTTTTTTLSGCCLFAP